MRTAKDPIALMFNFNKHDPSGGKIYFQVIALIKRKPATQNKQRFKYARLFSEKLSRTPELWARHRELCLDFVDLCDQFLGQFHIVRFQSRFELLGCCSADDV